jgi:sterol desaturase/sphingolipid hydroxylase (fatty acid hydroxylase superfamily)
VNDRKSVSGLPLPGPAPRPVVMSAEARIARRRLWPSMMVYGASSAAILLFAVHRYGLIACLPWLAAGASLWTLVEYLVHRFVLHGAFPDGPGAWRRFLHRRFDHLHWHHHREPWNGRHISGTLQDTAPVVLALAMPAILLPQPAGAVSFASFLLSYLAEEWVHLSVHFCSFRGRYFQYVRRHHLYHHGSRIGLFAFGLTSGVWDRVYGTHVPPLAARRRFATSSVSVEAPSSEPPPARRDGAASLQSRWRAGASA